MKGKVYCELELQVDRRRAGPNKQYATISSQQQLNYGMNERTDSIYITTQRGIKSPIDQQEHTNVDHQPEITYRNLNVYKYLHGQADYASILKEKSEFLKRLSS